MKKLELTMEENQRKILYLEKENKNLEDKLNTVKYLHLNIFNLFNYGNLLIMVNGDICYLV